MSKLPHHPDQDRLQALHAPLHTLAAGETLFRVYRRGGAHPTLWNAFRHFGPTGARFDHHLRNGTDRPVLQTRGIIYLSSNVATALAEVFQLHRTVNRADREPWLVGFELVRDLSLLDLTGEYPLRAGASMKLVTGPRAHSQNWSRGFYEAYPALEGLIYPSSLTNRPVYALYERANAVSPFPAQPTVHRALHDPTLLATLRRACAEIGYLLV